MTRKRKWMMGLLALGVGALVMDRTLLGPPEQASASQASADAGAAAAAPVEGEATPAAAAGEGVGPVADAPADLSDFARRLASLPAQDGAAFTRKDAFDLPAAWVPAAPVAPSQAQEQPPELSVEAQRFLTEHVHNGTIIIPAADSGPEEEKDVYIAVIDGKRFFVGMDLDGFRLVRVLSGRSLWRSIENEEQLVLRELPPR